MALLARFNEAVNLSVTHVIRAVCVCLVLRKPVSSLRLDPHTPTCTDAHICL